MKVVFSDAAKSDLTAIGNYIAEDNPHRALSFVKELHTATLALGDTPRAYPLIPRYENHGLRRRPIGNYSVFYQVETDRVLIVHILHAARDYERLLFPVP
ncbi:type II toxin-antitoxin system RelE/ParE family toxin [Fimbriiglobus ruber]|uniref:Death on curing protein, Doc toxin n=1 Tax=Fimbriiglobus ruber TaxID=1908690 RepID=A0A225E6C9_9BACT|nr:type II toxin-antitoxin system RelE/ParE family toxin [Fimbriiglobus ruber]OWK47324.1 Death on curing protein, Doc toxin [Fimbriiglobus ruber]